MMNQEQALQILTQALNAANMKGVFSLTDSVNIMNAINTLGNLIKETSQSKQMVKEPKKIEKA